METTIKGNSGTAELPSLKNLLELKKKYDAPTVDQLPESYKTNNDKERLYIWAANNFLSQIRHRHPQLQPMCLISKNECGVEKLISTFVKPTILPFSHLFEIDNCASFVADYICYHDKRSEDELSYPAATVASPTLTLATQLGNSLEMSNVLVSFLTGFGFKAFVVCGFVTKGVSDMDRSGEQCLAAIVEEAPVPQAKPEAWLKYKIEKPPILESSYSDFLQTVQDAEIKAQLETAIKSEEVDLKEVTNEVIDEKEEAKKSCFHAWVYVKLTAEVSFFIEATTGERKRLDDPNYIRINSVWNHENYWLCANDEWKSVAVLDLDDENKWISFVTDLKEIEGKDNSSKRLLSPLQCWVANLEVPNDSYELLYRLGQKTETFEKVKVEYFAPFLLKEGVVQRIQHYHKPLTDNIEAINLPYHTIEKFRHRVDKMEVRETFHEQNRTVERFRGGRKDNLKSHEYFRLTSNHPTEFVSTFYMEARFDGLHKRIFREMEIMEEYQGRIDGLIFMKSHFVMGEKKFGPAEGGKSGKEVARIVERYAEPDNEEDEDEDFNPGRVLNTKRIMEKTFDVENDRVILRFHREGGQLFCKTVEFLVPRNYVHQPTGARVQVTLEDCKIYMVDPRDDVPCIRELNLIFHEQMKCQQQSIERVLAVEKEMNGLLENRMKELSANDMEIWRYDVKRNSQVKKGRIDEERAKKFREKSIMDIDLDFLAPYLERQPSLESLTKSQAIALRDDCLTDIRTELKEKETDLVEQLNRIKGEISSGALSLEDANTKRFLVNVLETRLSRQQRSAKQYYANAERKVMNDPRILQIIQGR